MPYNVDSLTHYKTQPNFKQKAVLANIVESGGKITYSKAMIKAGYSPQTAKSPKKLTESKGWQELLDEIDDDWILKEIKGVAKDNDKRAKLQAIEMLLRLKNKYPDKKLDIGIYQQRNEIFNYENNSSS